jgi:hypothetical protein
MTMVRKPILDSLGARVGAVSPPPTIIRSAAVLYQCSWGGICALCQVVHARDGRYRRRKQETQCKTGFGQQRRFRSAGWSQVRLSVDLCEVYLTKLNSINAESGYTGNS